MNYYHPCAHFHNKFSPFNDLAEAKVTLRGEIDHGTGLGNEAVGVGRGIDRLSDDTPASNGRGHARLSGCGNPAAGRLTGETMAQGRRMYLVVLDGQMSAKVSSGYAAISFSGYTLIDAATALYASTNMLIQMRVIGSAGMNTINQVSKVELRF